MRFLLSFFLLSACVVPLAARTLSLNDPAAWSSRVYDAAGMPVSTALSPKEKAVPLPISFPARAEFVTPAKKSWKGWQELVFTVVLPENLPAACKVYVFTKDNDHLWRQVRLESVAERGKPVKIRVPIAGDAAVKAWRPSGHQSPWKPLTPGNLLEYGIAFDLDVGEKESFSGMVQLLDVTLEKPGLPASTFVFRNLHQAPRQPRVGERWELSFELGEWYDDPFDPEYFSLTAKITLPNKKVVTVRGFYYEDFLHNPEVEDKTRALSPVGTPCFKIRYTPLIAGVHRVKAEVATNDKTLTLPPLSFTAAKPAPDWRGFVRIDPKDECRFAWDDGTPFWEVGINVRSPYDNRYKKIAPYSVWQNEGLTLYDRLFAEYEKNGISLVEVWMSSWWLALEWIPDAPGFHGVGYYNQYRAWMLDHILAAAERHNIRLLLVFNNHGKFGMTFDTEWSRNPYNKACGGFLDRCEEYFTNERARNAFKRTCDYIVARWGYSPHIMSWKLFTEVDLTGPNMQYYVNPEVAAWHREMGAYLKSIDPNRHLVTTHWMLGYHRINEAIANVKELDFLSTDAYYQGGGSRRMMQMFTGSAQFARAHHKPLLITEYGGSPYADSMENLIKQAHLGLWAGFFDDAPSTPMFWWFALSDEKKLGSYYRAMHNFAAGETSRGFVSSQRELTTEGLYIYELRQPDQLYAWILDAAYYFSETENLQPTTHKDFTFSTVALKPGNYKVELWDVPRGRLAETRKLTVTDKAKPITLALPPFVRDIAFKIKPEKR